MLFLIRRFSGFFEFHDKGIMMMIIIIISILADTSLHTLASVVAEQRFFLVNVLYVLQKNLQINDSPAMCWNPAHT